MTLDDMVVLVDQDHGVMHAVNPAGAAAWASLGKEPVEPAFAAQLTELDLISETDQGSPVPSDVFPADGEPRVLRSNMLLQVAASHPMHRGGWF